jgi:hypothetical protein
LRVRVVLRPRKHCRLPALGVNGARRRAGPFPRYYPPARNRLAPSSLSSLSSTALHSRESQSQLRKSRPVLTRAHNGHRSGTPPVHRRAMALRPLATANSQSCSLVGQRLAGAIDKGRPTAALRAVPAAPESGSAPKTTDRRRERAASVAQAAEGFRECCIQSEVAALASEDDDDSMYSHSEEETLDDVFVAMHAPYEIRTRDRCPPRRLQPDSNSC